MNLKTKIDYDFSNYNFSTEEKLKLIAKYEKQMKDVFLSDLGVTLTSDSEGNIWFKIVFYINATLIDWSYCDRMIYMSSYDDLKDVLSTNDKPFYNHPIYHILDWTFNGGNNVKYSLDEAIEFIKMVYTIAYESLKKE